MFQFSALELSKENSDFDLQPVKWVNKYLKICLLRADIVNYTNVRYLKFVNKVKKFACFDFSPSWCLTVNFMIIIVTFYVKEFSNPSYNLTSLISKTRPKGRSECPNYRGCHNRGTDYI